jgi:adenine-specific DNA-methyltransferase
MKYMGSKRTLLNNGLGEMIESYGSNAQRMVDLFCGSASVAWFAAESLRIPILAADLQEYAVVLARSVLERTGLLDARPIWKAWWERAEKILRASSSWSKALGCSEGSLTVEKVRQARALTSEIQWLGPLWSAYGGYYFSPVQAAVLDALLRTLPRTKPARLACRAALIMTASRCAAAPGHTAQPFRPTPRGRIALQEAWSVKPDIVCEAVLSEICSRAALVASEAIVADALALASALGPGDLVFVDPPYSAVQYSRFYHVLETIARGWCGPVDGAGRYPPSTERPRSRYSLKGQALGEARELVRQLAASGCRVILTFPVAESSNGLTARHWIDLASPWFRIREEHFSGRFSTLGGNNEAHHRRSRQESAEAIVVLDPKGS